MKILILGSGGFVGKALTKRLEKRYQVLTPTSWQLNLINRQNIRDYFSSHEFDIVINAAGLVGGIQANSTRQSDFLYQNTLIQIQALEAAAQKGVKKFFNLASSCIYPKNAPQPIREDSLLTGSPEPTNEGYALAKITGTKYAEFLKKEGKLNVTTLMPTNIYGYQEIQSVEDAHVITALIKRFIQAKNESAKEVEVWGSGKALREFMHVDDFADAVEFLLGFPDELPAVLNIGTGDEITIHELASKLKAKIGLKAKLKFNSLKPEGMSRKCIDSHTLNKLGWKPQRTLEQSLQQTVESFMRES